MIAGTKKEKAMMTIQEFQDDKWITIPFIDKLIKIAKAINNKYGVIDINGELRLTVFNDNYEDEELNGEQLITDSTIHTIAFLSMCVNDLTREYHRFRS